MFYTYMEKQIKIEIRNRWTGNVLFEYSSDDNTIAKTVRKAVESGANLYGADLSGANLRDAYLSGAYLSDANLRGADLRGADLSDADLRGADLYGADLRGADLSGAYLSGADLRDAYLSGADLSGADLSDANMRGAYLRGADLSDADLRGADLSDAYLSDADLRGADLSDAKGLYFACPSEGSFIGWKKTSGYIVKLRIPEDARRSSATGNKCRCDKAFVVEIQNIDGSKANVDTVSSSYDSNFAYVVGAKVEVNNFGDNRWNECAPGIHFFIDRRAAVEY